MHAGMSDDGEIRVCAYYALHYGAEYLDASIQSIYNHVDKILILYTPSPSFGFMSFAPCPETEDQLKAIALKYPKVEWHQVEAPGEGQHRAIAFQKAAGHDLLLVVDADEVWNESSLSESLIHAFYGDAWRVNILGFVHFWKSFNYACYDCFAPGRIYNLRRNNRNEDSIRGLVYHFGYAQSKAIIDYKWSIHGHKAELRPEWRELYENWKPGDTFLHPASRQAWPEAIPFDKNTLPEILKAHPNFNKETI